MDINSKYKRICELEVEQDFLRHQIKLFRERQTVRTTNIQDISVQGGIKLNTQEEILLKICDAERELEFATKEINNYYDMINSYKAILREFGDYTQDIAEYKAKGLSNKIIARRIGVSNATLYRILKKLSKKIS